MRIFLVICTSLMVFSTVNGQLVQYVSRIRNFSIESETDNVYMIEMAIYQDRNEHKLAAAVDITQDFIIKSIEVILHRCSFEKFYCENFQRWKFTRNLNSIVYMKNQIWTPIFAHVTPKLNIPSVKKNVYRSPDVNANPNAIITWYPEAVNYFWRAEIILNDYDDKKPLILKFELEIFTFVERKKTRKRGETRTSNTTKKTE